MVERVKTGIEGLDKALNGGIPYKNIVLISGGAGTGKSTLALQYLVNGATKFGEKGLYISTEQTKEDLYKAAQSYNWNLDQLEKSGKLKIAYFDVVETDSFLDKIYELYMSFQPKRVVVDSLTTLSDSLIVRGEGTSKSFSLVKIAQNVSPMLNTERLITKHLLYHLMKKLRLFESTIFLTSELLDKAEGLSADEISEFICDGVIVMKVLIVGDSVSRTLEIKKMRYSPIKGGGLSIEFSPIGITTT